MTTTENGARNVGLGDEDCWIGVTDPKKRKQIQDRLAQRARRKRLALARDTSTTQLVKRKAPRVPETGSTLDCSSSIPLMPIPINVYSALYANGTFLNLSCSQALPALSSPAPRGTPPSLRPTPLQLMTIHPLWIDRFPFPKWRENFILMLGVLDPEEFVGDLFSMVSFRVEMGCESWDGSGWRMEEGFAKKWGFLFDENLFGSFS